MVRLQDATERILRRDERFSFSIDGPPTDLLVEAYDGEAFVGHFRLSHLPSNPFYVVSWGVKVAEDYQGQGIGQHFLDLRLDITREAGAHTYLNTVRWDNHAQVHIMRKYGFEPKGDEGEDTALWMRSVNTVAT